MIEETCPEGTPGIMKFIAKNEGLRGHMIAINNDGTKAIVLVLNTAFNGMASWGDFVLVEEDNPTEWPKLVKQVTKIPNGWKACW